MFTREQERLIWRTSSYSNANNGACVEVAHPAGGVAVRDSKDRPGGQLSLHTESWRAFASAVDGVRH